MNTLGIDYPFTLQELKSAYRKLCLQHHPDTGDGNRQKLELVMEAYNELKASAK